MLFYSEQNINNRVSLLLLLVVIVTVVVVVGFDAYSHYKKKVIGHFAGGYIAAVVTQALRSSRTKVTVSY